MYTAQFKSHALTPTGDATLVVGVSVGSSEFDNGQREAILRAALKSTGVRNIVLLVADTLQRYTLAMDELMNSPTPSTPEALSVAAKYRGNMWVKSCMDAITQLQEQLPTSPNKLSTAEYVRWSELSLDDSRLEQVKARYRENIGFKDAVNKTLVTFLSRFLTQQVDKRTIEGRNIKVKRRTQTEAVEPIEQVKQQLNFASELQAQLDEFGFGDAVFKTMLTLGISTEKMQLLLEYGTSYVLEECSLLMQLGQARPGLTFFAYPQREKSVPAFMKARELFLQPHNITALQYVEIELTKQYKKLQAPSHRTRSHTSYSSTEDEAGPMQTLLPPVTNAHANGHQNPSSQAQLASTIGIFGPRQITMRTSTASDLEKQGLYVKTVEALASTFRDDPETFTRFLDKLTNSPTTLTVAGAGITMDDPELQLRNDLRLTK